ncbi:hypothetical protein EMPS_02291 [Entomortierella parvispora]|uniref:Atos-like conserved domain-containing protein n=1 Tax=Entomortierella parvispora TaxID=205924 RepID=A0A9P3H4K9_9FUNG|nr:hypothetical protein EMPS_02291 [Entomortierella parvispora]
MPVPTPPRTPPTHFAPTLQQQHSQQQHSQQHQQLHPLCQPFHPSDNGSNNVDPSISNRSASPLSHLRLYQPLSALSAVPSTSTSSTSYLTPSSIASSGDDSSLLRQRTGLELSAGAVSSHRSSSLWQPHLAHSTSSDPTPRALQNPLLQLSQSPVLQDTMPASNVFLGPSQSSAGYSASAGTITGSPDIHVTHDRAGGHQHHLPRHQYGSSNSSLSPNIGCGQRLASSLPHGPDPEVMEFISKIGQIIIKARTVSRPAPTSISLCGSGTEDSLYGLKYPPHQQNLELALQDLDLWKSNTPVHVNVLHSEQHVLLERWVISYTPAASTSSPMSPLNEPSSRNTLAAVLSPKTKPHQQQVGPYPGSLSPTTLAAPRKDTTDLVLLLQSLYTQIRSLPLQSCLTSFEEKTKLTKADLAYSITSAHEEITHVRQHNPSNYSLEDESDAPITDPSELQYTEFASSLKSTLPLEFVQSASLKVINFEASHVQWGCVRVTGMYDESVGNRIDPKDFQDLTKTQKKHHKSKTTSSSVDSEAKAERRKHRSQSTLWTQRSIPPVSPTQRTQDNESGGLTTESISKGSGGDVTPTQEIPVPQDPSPRISPGSQRPSSPVPSPQEQLHARLQSLKRNGDRLFSSLTSSRAKLDARLLGEGDQKEVPSILQDSLLPKNDLPLSSENQERMSAYQFPPPPSSPQSIPQSKRPSTIADEHLHSHPSSLLERTPKNVDFIPPKSQSQSLQQSPPFAGQHYHHSSHHPVSTSPLAHVITRRRSSRLSIVTNCNDDSPDPTRPQSPLASESLPQEQKDQHDAFVFPPGHVRRRASFQGPGPSFELDDHMLSGQSPPRPSFLRRSSLNPISTSHGDLFGSLVGSYEESILSGRMSTLPSKPLIFTAQIGALANQDYKDCPPKLRCPKHVQLEFPAVFYDYDSSSRVRNGQQSSMHPHSNSLSHSHSNSHSLSHSHSFSGLHSLHQTLPSHTVHSKPGHSHSFGHHASISPSFHSMGSLHSLGSFSSSPVLGSFFPHGGNSTLSHGSGQGSTLHHISHSVPTTQDDPVLPYVGNLDLDSGFRGSRRFARMPGGMRLPLRGQVQVMIKNPNKTVVKVFLVPYDFTDMPPGTKTFLRQKHYSTGPGMGPLSASAQNGGTLRYAIHLQFCCPAPGYVYLYRSIRVVFANRVPDGKESLRVVLEGLGLGSRTLTPGKSCSKDSSAEHDKEVDTPRPPNLEERYVKMRKGEVPFSSSKRKNNPNGLGLLDMNGDTYMFDMSAQATTVDCN